MWSSNLIRLGGLAAMVSGVLFAVPFPLGGYFPQAYGFLPLPLREIVAEILVFVALLLVPVGLVGFHALQRHSYGPIGLAGFWLGVVASLVVAFGVADYLIWGDVLQAAPPVWLLGLGALGFLGGFVLYGVATLQAKVLPRWCGVAFIGALPTALVSSIVGFDSMFLIVFGLAWLALGYALWGRRKAPAGQQPRRVR